MPTSVNPPAPRSSSASSLPSSLTAAWESASVAQMGAGKVRRRLALL